MATNSHDQSFSDHLRARVRLQGPAPLVTYYDATSRERTELSAVSFVNWVDKTSNFLQDEVALDQGDIVALPLAFAAPGHWITLIWAAAAWQTGATVVVGGADDEAAPDLTVLGPDWKASYPGDDAATGEWVACALHPLGLGFSEELPPGLTDFAVEVRAQPDVFAAAPVPSTALAWRSGAQGLTQNDLVVTTSPSSVRTLVHAGDPWTTIRDALIAPVIGGGSSVVIAGDMGRDQLTRVLETERVAEQTDAQRGDPA